MLEDRTLFADVGTDDDAYVVLILQVSACIPSAAASLAKSMFKAYQRELQDACGGSFFAASPATCAWARNELSCAPKRSP
jgi:hypothetical protein